MSSLKNLWWFNWVTKKICRKVLKTISSQWSMLTFRRKPHSKNSAVIGACKWAWMIPREVRLRSVKNRTRTQCGLSRVRLAKCKIQCAVRKRWQTWRLLLILKPNSSKATWKMSVSTTCRKVRSSVMLISKKKTRKPSWLTSRSRYLHRRWRVPGTNNCLTRRHCSKSRKCSEYYYT